MPLGSEREPRGWIDHKRGADRHEELAGKVLLLRPGHGLFRHRLAKGDCRRLYVPAALAFRRRASLFEIARDVRKFVAALTNKTAGVGSIAMQLDDALVRNSGRLVQTIDILSDDGAHASGLDQSRECAMTAARLRMRVEVVHDEFAPPGLLAQQRIAQKIRKFNRLVFQPRRSRRTEIRYP